MKAIILLICFASSVFGAARPNILWLIAEDFGPHLGCCGTKEVWTPNLDKLAAEGVHYTRFFTGHVCSPSRSSFMTGMHAITIGAHNHRSHRGDGYKLPDGVRVLTDWMRDAGYFTANLRELPEACGFKGTGKTDWNFAYEGKPFDSDKWDDLKTHQPFYAQINFSETHRKFRGPKRADPAKVEIPPYYPDHPITREDWAAYLDDTSELDRKIGLVLQQLEKDGLAENTVVIFFGDNGQAHVRGKQFCYDSGLHTPLIIRWPKRFPPPKHFPAGTQDRRLIASIDLAPTMLAIAGAPKPAKMQGRIFLGDRCEPERQYVFGARDRCDETVMRIRTVRDARYRYIRNFTNGPLLAPNAYKERQYPVWNLLKELHAQGKLTPAQAFLCQPHMPPEELYDVANDPFEIHNLANSPEHQEVLKRLRKVLEDWIEEANDQGRVPEPPGTWSGAAAAAAKGVAEPGKKRKGKKQMRRFVLAWVALLAAATVIGAVPRPNIVLIISDDHGWTDYSFMGHPHIQTPCLDKLAAQSLTFRRGYVPSSLCCPSLAAIITGLYPHQNKITCNDPPGPPPSKKRTPQEEIAFREGRKVMTQHMETAPTLPRLLAKEGYLSFQTGKWWQGDYRSGGFTHGMTKGQRHGDEGLDIGRKTMQPIYDFIATARKEGKPWMVWYAPMLPHTPHNPPEALLAKYQPKTNSIHMARYWAMVEWFDQTCGQLLDHLDQQGLANNTIVLYVTDNGWIQAPKSGGHLRSKLTPYDAGLRTPIMIRWPGKVKPRMSDELAMSIDLAPTVLAALGLKPIPDMQGINLLDPKAVRERTAIFGECFLHTAVDLHAPAKNLVHRWVIDGYQKLILPFRNGDAELYDLKTDPHEKNNLAAQKPDAVKTLTRMLDAWWKPE